MFQYFPDDDVAIASLEGQVFLLSRTDKPSGSFRAVDPLGLNRTEEATDYGLATLFFEAADSSVAAAMQSVDFGIEMGEDDLAFEEQALVEEDPGDVGQNTAVWIDPCIPAHEKLAFVRDVVAYRHLLLENPSAEDQTHVALFGRIDLAAWHRMLRLLEIYPRDMERERWRRPFCAWPVRKLRVSADSEGNGEDGCVWGREAGVLSVSWETLKTAAARSLGPEGFASEAEYSRVRRAAEDLTGRAVGTTIDLLGRLRPRTR